MTSVSPRLEKRRRTFVRLLGEIQHALNTALNEEKEKRGLNKTQIAKILGLDRSAISKRFDGRHNMTLETLADLAYALGRPVKVMLPERAKSTGSNRVTSHTPTGLVAAPVLASIKSAIESETASTAAANNIPVFSSVLAAQASGRAPYGLASVRQGSEAKQ